MNFSEETLMAYVDGELDAATREQVEQAVAADPEVARRVAAHQALNRELRAGFDPVLEEPVPARLVSLVRGAHKGSKPGELLQFRLRPVAPTPVGQVEFAGRELRTGGARLAFRIETELHRADHHESR